MLDCRDVQSSVDLRVTIGSVELLNPVLAASGTFAYGVEFAHLVDLNQLGGIVTKGLSLEPKVGAPPPRLRLTPAGMVNAVGLQNIGVRAFVAEKLARLRTYRTRVFVNVFGHTMAEYEAVIQQLEAAEGIAGYELNVSCPNTDQGGREFAAEAGILAELVARVRRRTSRPLWVKLPPEPTRLLELAQAAGEAGADALTIANTVPAMPACFPGKQGLGRRAGGLSGPAIRPIVLKLVWEAARQLKVPVVAAGGIETADDALEYLLAGATAIQVGTAHFVDPRASLWVIKGLVRRLVKNKCFSIKDLKIRFPHSLSCPVPAETL